MSRRIRKSISQNAPPPRAWPADRFGRRVLACKDPVQLANLLAHEAKRLCRARRAWVWVHLRQTPQAVRAAVPSRPYGPEKFPAGQLLQRLPGEGQIRLWSAPGGIRRADPAGGRTGTGRASPALRLLWQQMWRGLGTHPEPENALLLRLGPKGAGGAAVLLAARRGQIWGPADIARLDSFGHLAGMALAALEQRRLLEQRIRQSSAVSEIAQNINATLELDILLRLIILEITKALHYQAGDIWLKDPRFQRLVFQTSLGLQPADRGQPLAGPLTAQALEQGEPQLARTIAAGAGLLADPLAKEGVVSLAAMPLKVKNKVIGVMHLFAKQAKAFGRDELVLLKTLANQAAMAIENARLFNETKQKAQELLGLYEVAQVISEMSNLSGALAQIVERVSAILNVEKCWFMFWDESRRALVAQKEAIGAVEEQLAALHATLDENKLSAQVFREARPFYTNEAEAEPKVREEFQGIFKLRNLMAVPLRSGEQTLGVLWAANKKESGGFSGNDVRLFRTLASEATVVIQNANLYAKLHRSYFSIVQVISDMVDAREKYTRGHSERVSAYGVLIAEQLGLPAEQVEAITIAGLLHDIGKIGISEKILLKPRQLSAAEYQKIKDHPRIGERILETVEFPWDILGIIRHHHEHFDGAGYPDALRQGAIPLGARILAVADAFDVMTSDRTYRKARTAGHALAELRKMAGSQFDPEIVTVFEKAWEQRRGQNLPPEAKRETPRSEPGEEGLG